MTGDVQGCTCGHKLAFCHKVNAARWCGAPQPVEVYRAALFEIAKEAGADVSDGIPTWPSIEAWALRAVQELRRDYDEAISGALSGRDSTALDSHLRKRDSRGSFAGVTDA